MQNTIQGTPTNAAERTQFRRDILALMQRFVGDGYYPQCFPEPGQMQTPWQFDRRKTGMQEHEFAVARKFINTRPNWIWGLWLNTPVIDPRVIEDFTTESVEPNLWQPWIPRLDIVLMVHGLRLVFCEIVESITCAAIGEVITKTDIWMGAHPKGPNILAMYVIYERDNPLVRNAYLATCPDYIKDLIYFEQITAPPHSTRG